MYGQILVTDDMLGISEFYPKFVKKYVLLDKVIAKLKNIAGNKLETFPSNKNTLNGKY